MRRRRQPQRRHRVRARLRHREPRAERPTQNRYFVLQSHTMRTGGAERMNAGLTAVSWLDWKLGARLLLKYPALTIIGGLSLAGAIAVGAGGIQDAHETLYKRLPFPESGPGVRPGAPGNAAA